MASGAPTNSAAQAQECAQRLRKFHEAHATYEAAPDSEKENHFARRHAALMLVLATPPQSRDEICGVMRIALDELAKELMLGGPLPDAVSVALANCLRAIEAISLELSTRDAITESPATDSDAPTDIVIDLDLEIGKLDKFASLLAYLASNSPGKREEGVFFALMNGAEAIRDSLSSAVDKLMPAGATGRHLPRGRRQN